MCTGGRTDQQATFHLQETPWKGFKDNFPKCIKIKGVQLSK